MFYSQDRRWVFYSQDSRKIFYSQVLRDIVNFSNIARWVNMNAEQKILNPLACNYFVQICEHIKEQ